MNKNNVIDLKRFRAGRNKAAKVQIEAKDPQAPVLDITERRQEIISEERRKVRRTILTGFIGAFVVVPQKGLLKVDIYDISENGIAFDMNAEHGHFQRGEEVAMRVYLSRDTYFPFIARIQNQRLLEGEPTHRHGADFVRGTVNDEALFHFVKFIETVSASLERDSGDIMVSNLKK